MLQFSALSQDANLRFHCYPGQEIYSNSCLDGSLELSDFVDRPSMSSVWARKTRQKLGLRGRKQRRQKEYLLSLSDCNFVCVYRMEVVCSCISGLNVLIMKYGISEQYIVLCTSYFFKESVSLKSILLKVLCCAFNREGGIEISVKHFCACLILVRLESSQA